MKQRCLHTVRQFPCDAHDMYVVFLSKLDLNQIFKLPVLYMCDFSMYSAISFCLHYKIQWKWICTSKVKLRLLYHPGLMRRFELYAIITQPIALMSFAACLVSGRLSVHLILRQASQRLSMAIYCTQLWLWLQYLFIMRCWDYFSRVVMTEQSSNKGTQLCNTCIQMKRVWY